MRELEKKEIRKRGCDNCLDLKKGRKAKKYNTSYHYCIINKCPYDKCPYTELNKYDTYGDYLKK